MNSFSANSDSLTLHIRVTKKCNADCSYCSSYEHIAQDLMSLENLEKSLDFLSNFILKNHLGGTRKMITVQYVGGEISMVQDDYLKEYTDKVKEKLSPLFENFRHGAQSNLIASSSKINHLIDLFEGNIGTSVDHSTEQRTIGKSSQKYKTIFLKNLNYTKRIVGKNLSSILVVDKKMYEHVGSEIEIAQTKQMNLTLRPVFNGGSEIENVSVQDLVNLYEIEFDKWILQSNIRIEPFFSLLEKRLLKYENTSDTLASYSGCPFQNNCATSSINLEPNGDLYVCLDMADSKHYPFGNALSGIINVEIFDLLKARTEKLNQDCIQCDYYNECQGGCMNEAIEHTGEVYGKTQYCEIWKKIFSKIDFYIEKNGVITVNKWLKSLI